MGLHQPSESAPLVAGSHHRSWFGAIVLAVFVAAAFWIAPRSFRNADAPPDASRESAGLPAREDIAGDVTVTVTPGNLAADAPVWEFSVMLDTHSVELTDDLVQAAVLIDDQGNEHEPIAWDGAPAGGHHRSGTLRFRPIRPLPRSITLELRAVAGVAKRSFQWTF